MLMFEALPKRLKNKNKNRTKQDDQKVKCLVTRQCLRMFDDQTTTV